MAWTTPRTWIAGEIPTATTMNVDIRDNLNYLYSFVGTQSLWIPATLYYTSAAYAALQAVGTYPGSPLGTASAYALMSARAPVDYANLSTANIIVIPQATQAAADWDISVNYASISSAYNANSASNNTTTYNVTLNQLFAVDISSLITSLSTGQYMGVKLYLNNSAHDVHVLGLQLTW